MGYRAIYTSDAASKTPSTTVKATRACFLHAHDGYLNIFRLQLRDNGSTQTSAFAFSAWIASVAAVAAELDFKRTFRERSTS